MSDYDTSYKDEIKRCKANLEDKAMVYKSLWIIGLLILLAGVFA